MFIDVKQTKKVKDGFEKDGITPKYKDEEFNNRIELDVEGELLMKQYIKISPVTQKIHNKEIDPVVGAIEIIRNLFLNIDGNTDIKAFNDFIDNCTLPGFTVLSNALQGLLEEKKTK